MESSVAVGAGLSTVCVAGTLLYKLIRPRFPIKVNCWFCNTDSMVAYDHQNCWDCPQCLQYNGFTKDGRYNKDIPAQHREELRHFVSPGSAALSSVYQLLNRSVTKPCGSVVNKLGSEALDSDSSDSVGVLCVECCRNQQLKIKQLANFKPYDEERYDEEVERYSARLEEIYRLCEGCEAGVKSELARQQHVLSEINNSISRDTSHNSLNDNSISHYKPVRLPWYLLLSCAVCVLVSLSVLLCTTCLILRQSLSFSQFSPALFASNTHTQLLTAGLLVQLLTAALSLIVWRLDVLDVLACVVWLVNTLTVCYLPPSHIYSSHWLLLRSLFCCLALALCVSCLLYKWHTIKYVAHFSGDVRDDVTLGGRKKRSDSVSSSVSGCTRDSGLPDEPRSVRGQGGSFMDSSRGQEWCEGSVEKEKSGRGEHGHMHTGARGEQSRLLTPGVFDRMRGMKLGTPAPLNHNNSKHAGVFSLNGLGVGQVPDVDTRSRLYPSTIGSEPGDGWVTPRPLLHPARFTVPQQPAALSPQTASSSVSAGLQGLHGYATSQLHQQHVYQQRLLPGSHHRQRLGLHQQLGLNQLDSQQLGLQHPGLQQLDLQQLSLRQLGLQQRQQLGLQQRQQLGLQHQINPHTDSRVYNGTLWSATASSSGVRERTLRSASMFR